MGQVRRQERELQVHLGACHMAPRARPHGPCVLDLSFDNNILIPNLQHSGGKQVDCLSPHCQVQQINKNKQADVVANKILAKWLQVHVSYGKLTYLNKVMQQPRASKPCQFNQLGR